MTARRVTVALVVAAVLTWWWLGRSAPRHRVSGQAVATTSPTSEPAASTTTTTVVAAHNPEPAEEDKGREEVDSYRRELADPGRSDLPPALFKQLTELGVRVQRAYLTSTGRDEFPGYFGRDPVPPLYTNVEIETAGARSRNGQQDAVDVTVIWSGWPVNGDPPVTQHQTIVVLVNTDGRWRPQAQFG